MSTLTEWQRQGIDIKVELATTGNLVSGSKITTVPLTPGGTGGVPAGMTQWAKYVPETNFAHYNFTTASNVFSVFFNTVPSWQNLRVGASQVLPAASTKLGMTVELTADVRQMAGKQPAYKTMGVQFWQGSSWNDAYRIDAIALSDWETVSVSMPYGGYDLRWYIAGGKYPDGDGNVNSAWGVQYQNVYLREYQTTDGSVLPDLGWVDITCDVQGIQTRYGRETFNQRYDIGTVSISLLNDDGIYSYHATHPLNLAPGRQVRVTATKDGVTYPLAFGIIDTIKEGYSIDGRVLSIWDCVDPQTTLSNTPVRTVAMSIGLDESYYRVRNLIRQVGYPFYKVMGSSMQTPTMLPITTSGRTVRDEIGVTADSEAGSFYAERNGQLMYFPPGFATDPAVTDPWKDPLTKVQADMLAAPAGEVSIVDEIPTQPGAPSICVNQLNVDWSQARIINTVSLANAGGTAQEFVNEDSVRAYGPHTYQRHDYVLSSDSYLPGRAQQIMDGWSDPVLRVNSIAYNPGVDGNWDFALKVFLNWLIRVWYRNEKNRWGYAVCLHVQSVQHTITPTAWSIQMSVDQPESFVELEDSLYGWDMGLWDEALWDQVAPAGALWSDPESTWSTSGDNWGE